MEKLLTAKQASAFLEEHAGHPFPVTTMGQWRLRKTGPKWISMIGRRIFYRESDLLQFLRGTVHYTDGSIREAAPAQETEAE
jgi:hypothetical protein